MSTFLEVAKLLLNNAGSYSNVSKYVGSMAGTGGYTTVRFGTVTAINGTSITVTMEDTGEIVYATSTTPVSVGDRVSVIKNGQNVVIYATQTIVGMIDEKIESVDIEYAVGDSATDAPDSGWTTDAPSVDDGEYLWQRTKTVTGTGTYYSNPVCISAASSATGVASAVVEYAVNNNGNSAPTSGWQSTVPSVSQGQYLWSRTTTAYTDGKQSVSYGVSYQGTNGQNGSDGQPGQDGHDGVGIQSSSVSYQVSGSGTVVPSGAWQPSPPSMQPGQFLWTRTIFTYTDGDSTTTYSVSYAGENGQQGIQGPPGENGQPLYTWIKYADTPTSGMSDDPDGKAYMGIAYNKASATESSNYSDYAWSLVKGAQGDQGIQGPPGENGQTLYTWIKYATSASGAGMSDDPTGKDYIGIAYNKTVQQESSNPADYAWSLIQGEKGVGVKAIVEQYYLSTSKTTQSGGSWLTTCPEWKENCYIWTRSQITWDDNSVTYTTPVLASAINQANENAAQATYYVWNDTQGTHITTQPNDATTGYNALLSGTALYFRDGTKTIATYGQNEISMMGLTIRGDYVDGRYAQAQIGAVNLRIGYASPNTSGWTAQSVSVQELVFREIFAKIEGYTTVQSTMTNTFQSGSFYQGYNNIFSSVCDNVGAVTVGTDRYIRVNLEGYYEVTLYGLIQSCSSGDLCHFGLGTSASNMLIDKQIAAGGPWDCITATDVVWFDGIATQAFRPWYKCEQGYGSILTNYYVTFRYLGGLS